MILFDQGNFQKDSIIIGHLYVAPTDDLSRRLFDILREVLDDFKRQHGLEVKVEHITAPPASPGEDELYRNEYVDALSIEHLRRIVKRISADIRMANVEIVSLRSTVTALEAERKRLRGDLEEIESLNSSQPAAMNMPERDWFSRQFHRAVGIAVRSRVSALSTPSPDLEEKE